MVFWGQIPKYHRNGYILGYKVCYKRADTNNSILYCTAVFALGLELGGLQPYTPYWITVLGYNNQGEGPTSQPLQVWTDEFGKLQWIFVVCSAYAFLASECSIFRSSTEAAILDSRDKGNLEQRNNSPPPPQEGWAQAYPTSSNWLSSLIMSWTSPGIYPFYPPLPLPLPLPLSTCRLPFVSKFQREVIFPARYQLRITSSLFQFLQSHLK